MFSGSLVNYYSFRNRHLVFLFLTFFLYSLRSANHFFFFLFVLRDFHDSIILLNARQGLRLLEIFKEGLLLYDIFISYQRGTKGTWHFWYSFQAWHTFHRIFIFIWVFFEPIARFRDFNWYLLFLVIKI